VSLGRIGSIFSTKIWYKKGRSGVEVGVGFGEEDVEDDEMDDMDDDDEIVGDDDDEDVDEDDDEEDANELDVVALAKTESSNSFSLL